MNKDLGVHQTPVGITVNDTESHGKNLTNWEILVKSIIAQVVMIFVFINMMLNVEVL